MKKLLLLLATTWAPAILASTFYNDAHSKIMHGASQYYQYRSSRFDMAIENKSTTANIVKADTLGSASRLSNKNAENKISAVIFQRLFTANGGLGLRMGISNQDQEFTSDNGFYANDQFNFQTAESTSSTNTAKFEISPLITYSLTEFLTFGIEVENEFGRRKQSNGIEEQFSSQTGIPSLTLHVFGLELGSVYRPTSRRSYSYIGTDAETRERTNSALTSYFRIGLGIDMNIGGYYRIDNYSDYEGAEVLAENAPVETMGAHIEYFRDGTTKFELVVEETSAAEQPTGVMSFDSAKKSSATGSIVIRTSSDNAFSLSGTFERISQKIKMDDQSLAKADGEGITLRISTQWKM